MNFKIGVIPNLFQGPLAQLLEHRQLFLNPCKIFEKWKIKQKKILLVDILNMEDKALQQHMFYRKYKRKGRYPGNYK